MNLPGIFGTFIVIVAGIACAGVALAQSAPTTLPAQPSLDQAELERQFEERMSGAVLVGRFTDTARPNAAPREERYTIQRVSKVDGGGDRWLFVCRIQFGRNDVALPLTIPVKWAGDTPVISVSDMMIPGLGTYHARVVIDADNYAGIWRDGTHGGHLWGRIERANATTSTATRPATAEGDKVTR